MLKMDENLPQVSANMSKKIFLQTPPDATERMLNLGSSMDIGTCNSKANHFLENIWFIIQLKQPLRDGCLGYQKWYVFGDG